jgi:hypothetical protein
LSAESTALATLRALSPDKAFNFAFVLHPDEVVINGHGLRVWAKEHAGDFTVGDASVLLDRASQLDFLPRVLRLFTPPRPTMASSPNPTPFATMTTATLTGTAAPLVMELPQDLQVIADTTTFTSSDRQVPTSVATEPPISSFFTSSSPSVVKPHIDHILSTPSANEAASVAAAAATHSPSTSSSTSAAASSMSMASTMGGDVTKPAMGSINGDAGVGNVGRKDMDAMPFSAGQVTAAAAAAAAPAASMAGGSDGAVGVDPTATARKLLQVTTDQPFDSGKNIGLNMRQAGR